MRKMLIFLFVFISSIALGQQHLIGVQGGLNFANITSKELFNKGSSRIGFIGGIMYDFKLADKYRIGIDVLYSPQGIKDKVVYTDMYGTYGEENMEMNYDYLSIPIKFGYELGDKMKIIPKIGIVPAFLLKAELTAPVFDDDGVVIGHETIDHTDNASKFDFGGIVEFGLETNVSKSIVFSTNLNFKHSLTTFSNKDYFNGINMRHYGFSLTLGIKYQLNH